MKARIDIAPLPPIADEYLLVENSSIGTEEGDGVEAGEVGRVRQAHVIHLAVGLGVRVVAAEDEAGAGEGGGGGAASTG